MSSSPIISSYSNNYSHNGGVYDDENDNIFSFQYFINIYRGISYDWAYHLTMLILAIVIIMLFIWIFGPKKNAKTSGGQPLVYAVR